MQIPWMMVPLLLPLLFLGALAPGHPGTAGLSNPLLESGPDPWVEYRDGFYYYMHTTGVDLTVWKARSLAELKSAEKKVVWTPPSTGPYAHDIWAPEIHFLQGKWYIYFAADAGNNHSHRIWAIENSSPDPLQGEWRFKGKVADPSDRWAIDASVFEEGAKLYMIWSGWQGEENATQNIYIARMKNPWTIAGRRTRISTPEFPWEKVGDIKDFKTSGNPPHVEVNEGPEILQHQGKTFLIYSASGCWTDSYALGMLTADSRSNLLAAKSWKKSPVPVFQGDAGSGVYSPGHNSFFKARDGQDWILYHANSAPGQGCGSQRSPRAQPFSWNLDGSPRFGSPVSTAAPIAPPR